MLKVPTKTLLLVAALVWFAAGVNVASVGVRASHGDWTAPMLIAEAIVFILFGVMFLRIVSKHTKRILTYVETRTSIFNFFDKKSYILMVFMIALGVTLRVSGLLPDVAVASFYAGLGFALALAGLVFFGRFLRVCCFQKPA
ncbi:MAG: hypothetical protein LBS98_03805 [Coriobacteriales bacterium]|nr:hypothetical protein [Coriobacteriales bacterium]